MFTKKGNEEVSQKIENKPAEEIKAVKIKDQKPSQKEIVFLRVIELVKEKSIGVKANQPLKDCLTSEHLSVLYDRISKDFKDGKGKLKDTSLNQEKLQDEKKMRIYVIGLCSNWLRRDPRLNGKEVYKF